MKKTLILLPATSTQVSKTELRLLASASLYAKLTGDDLAIALAPFAEGIDLHAKADALSAYGIPVIAMTPESGDHYTPLAETASALFLKALKAQNASTALTLADSMGKDFAPRLAVLMDAAYAGDVVGFEKQDDEILFVHPMWAGRVLGHLRFKNALRVITVRASAFDALSSSAKAPVSQMKLGVPPAKARYLKKESVASKRPALTDARIVVSGGRGCQNAQGFADLIYGLADDLGAAVGATRAAVDEGWISSDAQVGQTGKAVAPELYFALGISGAIQHVAGLQNARCIVAINKDPDAPIFQWADFGLAADLKEAVPELRALILKNCPVQKM